MLETENCKVMIVWDEMWMDFSEYMYEKMFKFNPDHVIKIGNGLIENWRAYELY